MPIKIVPTVSPGKRRRSTFGSKGFNPDSIYEEPKRKKRKKLSGYGDKIVAKEYNKGGIV